MIDYYTKLLLIDKEYKMEIEEIIQERCKLIMDLRQYKEDIKTHIENFRLLDEKMRIAYDRREKQLILLNIEQQK